MPLHDFPPHKYLQFKNIFRIFVKFFSLWDISFVSFFFTHLFLSNSIKFFFLSNIVIPDPKYKYLFDDKNFLFFLINILDFAL